MKKKFALLMVFALVFFCFSYAALSLVADSDRDGVPDSADLCQGTIETSYVDSNGCSCSQKTSAICQQLYPGDGCCIPDADPLTVDCGNRDGAYAVCNIRVETFATSSPLPSHSYASSAPVPSSPASESPTATASQTFSYDSVCSDTDSGLVYSIKGTVTIAGSRQRKTDYCTFLFNRLREYYCTQDQRIASESYRCSNGCSNGACRPDVPEAPQITPETPLVETARNAKNMAHYSQKEVFLISDKDWESVLSLSPVAVWTENAMVHKHPLLIFHEEEDGFDADSAINFLQDYSPTRVTLVGYVPQELKNLLVAAEPLGAGLTDQQLQAIGVDDFFSYWSDYNDIVYSSNDYESALIASSYSSLINAPLQIIRNAQCSCSAGQTNPCIIDGYQGLQSCVANCSWGSCHSDQRCGDRIVNGYEECEGLLCHPVQPGLRCRQSDCRYVNDSSCAINLCSGKVCAEKPSVCQDNSSLLLFVGECNPITGNCTYRNSSIACPYGCIGGACRPDSCIIGRSCLEKQDYCINNLTLRNFTGVSCAEGSCVDYFTDVACDRLCLNGTGKCCGGNECPIAVTAVSVSDQSPFAGSSINVTCTINGNPYVNSIRAYVDNDMDGAFTEGDSDCGWPPGSSWTDASHVRFLNCNVGAAGSKNVACGVNIERSPRIGADAVTMLTVRSTECSSYSSQASCPASICKWVSECRIASPKYSGSSDRCVPIAQTVQYICGADRCQEECDGSNWDACYGPGKSWMCNSTVHKNQTRAVIGCGQGCSCQYSQASAGSCRNGVCGATCSEGETRSCIAAGGNPGRQACGVDCLWGACIISQVCGNNIIEGSEQCDGLHCDPDRNNYKCNQNNCSYSFVPIESDCSDGLDNDCDRLTDAQDSDCYINPCQGVSCPSKPPECIGNNRIVYGPGTCNPTDGQCRYVNTTVACQYGCTGSVCIDYCLGVSCPAYPPECTGDNLISYNPGLCNPANGNCVYTNITTFCQFGCSGSQCRSDPCLGVDCQLQADYCLSDGITLRDYTSSICSSGRCVNNYQDTRCVIACLNNKCCSGNECPVRITGTSVSDGSPFANTPINITCTIEGEPRVSSVFAYIDNDRSGSFTSGDYDCGYPDGSAWLDNFRVRFVGCNVGSAGTKNAACGVYSSSNENFVRSPQAGVDAVSPINVRSTDCSSYSSQSACPLAICKWVSRCSASSPKFSNVLDRCVPLSQPITYTCSAAHCGEACDGSDYSSCTGPNLDTRCSGTIYEYRNINCSQYCACIYGPWLQGSCQQSKDVCGAACSPGETRSCTTAESYVGTQSCSSACSWSGCLSSQRCGDGIINGNEQCEGTICDPARTGYRCNPSFCRYEPAAAESSCDDGIDNDCDGLADDTDLSDCSVQCHGAECNFKTKFGIFYHTWHCPSSEGSNEGPIYDVSEIQAGRQDWGPLTQAHWWGKPEQGYYCLASNDSVLRKHAEMLRDAGIDFVFLDATNNPYADGNCQGRSVDTITRPFERLLAVWSTIPGAPKVVPWVPFTHARLMRDPTGCANSKPMVDYFVEKLRQYPQMGFRYEGKPLLLVTENDNEWLAVDEEKIVQLQDEFTIRKMWAFQSAYGSAPPNGGPPEKWSFLEWCQDGFKESGGIIDCNQRITIKNGGVEQVPIGTAYQKGFMSNKAVSIPKLGGRTFVQQFRTLFDNPSAPIATITGWNEWLAGRFCIKTNGGGAGSDMSVCVTDHFPDGSMVFVDQYDREYNRDIEPSVSQDSDYYYQLMKVCISKYKAGQMCSLSDVPAPSYDMTAPFGWFDHSSASTISGSVNFSGWALDSTNNVDRVMLRFIGIMNASNKTNLCRTRQDVCNAGLVGHSSSSCSVNSCASSGWSVNIDTTKLYSGNYQITATACDTRNNCALLSGSPYSVTIDNGCPTGIVPEGPYSGLCCGARGERDHGSVFSNGLWTDANIDRNTDYLCDDAEGGSAVGTVKLFSSKNSKGQIIYASDNIHHDGSIRNGGYDIVSNGRSWLYCTARHTDIARGPDGAPFNYAEPYGFGSNVGSITINSRTHGYLCYNNTVDHVGSIAECCGHDACFNSQNNPYGGYNMAAGTIVAGYCCTHGAVWASASHPDCSASPTGRVAGSFRGRDIHLLDFTDDIKDFNIVTAMATAEDLTPVLYSVTPNPVAVGSEIIVRGANLRTTFQFFDSQGSRDTYGGGGMNEDVFMSNGVRVNAERTELRMNIPNIAPGLYTVRDYAARDKVSNTLPLTIMNPIINPVAASCGNNVIDPGEQCDTLSVPSSCEEQGFDTGQLSCNSICRFNTSRCNHVISSPISGIDSITRICVGNVNPPNGYPCTIRYTADELFARYARLVRNGSLTKVILVDSNDLSHFVPMAVKTRSSVQLIHRVYSRFSLVAPFLAASEHAVIISINATQDASLINELTEKLNLIGDGNYAITLLLSPRNSTVTGISDYGILDDIRSQNSYFASFISLILGNRQVLSAIAEYGLTVSDPSAAVARRITIT